MFFIGQGTCRIDYDAPTKGAQRVPVLKALGEQTRLRVLRALSVVPST